MGKGLLTTIGLGCALLVAGAQMPDAAEKDGPRPENVRDADKLAGWTTKGVQGGRDAVVKHVHCLPLGATRAKDNRSSSWL